jgi:hypothetical protein
MYVAQLMTHFVACFPFRAHFHRFYSLFFSTGGQVDFMGECDIVGVNVPNYGGVGLRVHMRTDNGNHTYAWNTNVAVQIGNDILEIDTENYYATKFWFNKQPTTFAALTGSIGKINKYYINGWSSLDRFNNSNQFGLEISLEEGDILHLIAWNRYAEFKFERFTSNFIPAVGAMGNYSTGNWTWRNGTFVSSPNNFLYGADWQVRSNEPLLFHNNRAPQFPTACKRPTGTQGWFNENAARDHCIARGALLTMLDMCTYDVYVTGDPNVAYLYDGSN